MKKVTKKPKPIDPNSIGDRIAYVRSNKLMSQEDLAKKINRKREPNMRPKQEE